MDVQTLLEIYFIGAAALAVLLSIRALFLEYDRFFSPLDAIGTIVSVSLLWPVLALCLIIVGLMTLVEKITKKQWWL